MKKLVSSVLIGTITIALGVSPVSAYAVPDKTYVDDILDGLGKLISGETDPGEIVQEGLDSGKELIQNIGDTFSRKASSDKYTQYVDKYVGMNAANVGYTSLGGDRMIELGQGYLQITYVTADGSYVGPDDEENLKNYVVTAQNIEPNTEVKFTFETDSDGTEYDYLVDFQTYTKIDLAVKKVKSDEEGPSLVAINPSPDKYTYYVRNYVGKNAATIGYESLGGDYLDAYGSGVLELNLAADDGSYVDYTDESILKQYVVTGQSIEPNAEIKYEYETDGDGVEYSNLIRSQTYDSITLTVTSITGEEVVSQNQNGTEDTTSVSDTTPSESADSASSDANGYEAIYNDYAQKIRDKTQTLLNDYRNESQGADINTKADLVAKKTEMLAELTNEGVEKMAKYMMSHGDSDGYTSWSSKLYDVYSEQGEVLMNEYLNNAW